MIIQTIFIGLSCFIFGAVSSCSTDAPAKPAVTKSLTAASSKKSSYLPGTASSSTIANSKHLPKDKHGMPTYKKASTRKRYVRTTAYSHMENEPGAYGRKNAAGTTLKYGNVRSVAADWSVYPLGTKLKIKGQSYIYVVDDYGSALVGTNTIDIYKPTLKSMNYWGTRKTEITVIEWGSYKRSLHLLKGRTSHSHCRKMYYGCKKKIASGHN